VVLENTEKAKNHWLQLQLKGPPPNRFAVGARVELTASGRRQMRQVTCGRGYLSQDDNVVAFGLVRVERADVTITWPDHRTQKATGLAADKRHEIGYAPN
jgi:hypothetical protein